MNSEYTGNRHVRPIACKADQLRADRAHNGMRRQSVELRVMLMDSDDAASAVQRDSQGDSAFCQGVVAAGLRRRTSAALRPVVSICTNLFTRTRLVNTLP